MNKIFLHIKFSFLTKYFWIFYRSPVVLVSLEVNQTIGYHNVGNCKSGVQKYQFTVVARRFRREKYMTFTYLLS